MLPKYNRLKKKKDFKKVFKEGKSFKEDFLFLKIAENNLKENRFGFVVSRKISRKTTVRNKLKRRLRDLVKIKLPELRKGIDCLFIALPGLEKRDFWELETILSKLFKKANIYLRKS